MAKQIASAIAFAMLMGFVGYAIWETFRYPTVLFDAVTGECIDTPSDDYACEDLPRRYFPVEIHKTN